MHTLNLHCSSSASKPRAPLTASRRALRSSPRALAAALGLSLGSMLALASSPGLARTELGAKLGVAAPTADEDDTGSDFGVWLGKRWELPAVVVGTELAGNFADFPGVNVYRGLVGAKLGVGVVFRPSVFGHVGLASVALPGPNETRFTYDLGAALDFTLLPLLDLGIDGAYVNLPDDSGDIDWVRFGAHAALVF